MTIMKSDLEIIEALDFDPDFRCESLTGCSKPAKVSLSSTCCNVDIHLCEVCFSEVKKSMEETEAMPGTTIKCLKCKATPLSWVRDFRWGPI